MGTSFSSQRFLKPLLFFVCLLGALSVLAPAALAQTEPAGRLLALDTAKALSQFTLDRWRTEDGLPNNSIMAQLKSKSGYIWLATYNGLSRFDGFSFKNFNQRTNPEFTTNSLFDLLEDRQGRLWIATNGGGVLKMTGEKFSAIDGSEYLPNKSITALAEDEEGQIWVGTRSGLALIRDNAYVDFPEFDRLKNLHVFELYADAKGSLWIGTVGEGLWELKNGYLRQYTRQQGLSNQSICALHEDSRGRLWIGTEEGINVMEQGQIKEVPVFNNSFSPFINDILQDESGTLWFATDDGLLRFAAGKFELLQTDTEGEAKGLQNVYSDGEGSLWIGTYYAGYLRLRDGKFRNYSKAEGLPNQVVNVVLPEQDGVWIGTNGGLAYLQQDIERTYLLENNSSANKIRDIYRDSKGILWVATYEGLFQQKGQAFERVMEQGSGLSSDKIRRILEDKNGHLWIGTRNGLFIRNPSNPEEVSVVDGLSGIFIHSLFEDAQGHMWVATNGKGLYRYNGRTFDHFTTAEGLSSDVVFDIWEDSDHNIWVGSNDGLNVYKKGVWQHLNERKGFFANTIFQMIPDSLDNVWVTTSKGVFLVKREDLLAASTQENQQITSIKHFTTADGMRSSEITALSCSRRGADGTLWFTTLDGVSAIHPRKFTSNHRPPLVQLERIAGDKVEHSLADEIHFAAGTRQYEIQYTGFNYYAPEATRFSYMLEGFDTEWQDAGNRRIAYYTNLPEGEYTFKVRAANEDGVWSEKIAQINLKQQAYYWNTLWFKTLAILLLVGTGLSIYYWHTQELKQKNLELEKLVEERTNHISSQKASIEHQKEELSRLNQLKDRLLSVLSHDLRQPFSSISGLLALLREKQIEQHEFQHFTKELNQQVKWQVHMLDNVLLWTKNQLNGLEIKPVLLNLYQLVEEIGILHRSQAGHKNISIINTVTPNTSIVADPDILHLVLRNLVGNAVKFTEEWGTITITSSMESHAYRIEVADNGVGIEKDKLQKLFNAREQDSQRGTYNEKGAGLGLNMCREFIEASGGRIWVESKQGVGSRFILELPLQNVLPGLPIVAKKVPAGVLA